MKQLEFKAGGNNEENEIKGIRNSAVYTRESETGHLPSLYYVVFWKNYLKDESNWESASVVQHLRKLVSTLYKEYPNKPTVTFPLIDLALQIARYTTPPNFNGKRKHGRPVSSIQKKAKH